MRVTSGGDGGDRPPHFRLNDVGGGAVPPNIIKSDIFQALILDVGANYS